MVSALTVSLTPSRGWLTRVTLDKGRVVHVQVHLQVCVSVGVCGNAEVANEALAGKGGPSPERESLSPSDSDEATNIEERKRQVQRWVSKMTGDRR